MTDTKITKSSIAEKVDDIAKLNNEFNKTKNDLTAKKSSIKDDMIALNLSEVIGNEYAATVSTRIKESLNEERTLAVLKAAGAHWLIHTKEYFDEAEIEQAIMTKEIDAKLLVNCTDETETKILSFKKAPKPKKKKD